MANEVLSVKEVVGKLRYPQPCDRCGVLILWGEVHRIKAISVKGCLAKINLTHESCATASIGVNI